MKALQWGVYRGRLDPAEGSEQAGRRPVLVVSRQSILDSLPVVTVLPLTSRKPGRRIYSTEAAIPAGSGGLDQDSVAMAHQIRTLAVSRLEVHYGTIEDVTLRADIRRALRTFLDLD